jgi:hypothetical protein
MAMSWVLLFTRISAIVALCGVYHYHYHAVRAWIVRVWICIAAVDIYGFVLCGRGYIRICIVQAWIYTD